MGGLEMSSDITHSFRVFDFALWVDVVGKAAPFSVTYRGKGPYSLDRWSSKSVRPLGCTGHPRPVTGVTGSRRSTAWRTVGYGRALGFAISFERRNSVARIVVNPQEVQVGIHGFQVAGAYVGVATDGREEVNHVWRVSPLE